MTKPSNPYDSPREASRDLGDAAPAPTGAMPIVVRAKLSVMMFLQYFVWGAWFVTLGTYLGAGLKFEGSQIGLAYGAAAIAAMVSPFFVALVADRYAPTQFVLAALHLIGAGLLYYVSTQTTFDTFYPLLIAYFLCYMPTLALTNSLSFQQMSSPEKQFPGIRVWGTIGWIVAGQLVGLIKLTGATFAFTAPAFVASMLNLPAPEGASLEPTAIPMQMAAAASALLGLFCLVLPHTPPKAQAQGASLGSILGLDAIKLLSEPAFAVFVLGSFLVCIPLQFYYALANNFLNSVGTNNAAFWMTWGQISEIVFMLLMPFFFVRLGVKKMLLVGMLAWVARYGLFAYGRPDTSNGWAMLFLGILLHGICYDFFFVTGQIYVDKKAPANMRGSAQGFIAFVTFGLGGFIGSWVAGSTLEHYKIAGSEPVAFDWTHVWLAPCLMAGVVMVLFGLAFWEKDADKA